MASLKHPLKVSLLGSFFQYSITALTIAIIMSSGFIAVSVCLIGLMGAVFTLAIFIQMIVSFPDMLSSNSQAYVHQQRKTYTLNQDQEPDHVEVTAEAEAEWEHEYDQEQEQEQERKWEQDHVLSMVGKWVALVDEATKGGNSEAEHPNGTQSSWQLRSQQVEPIRGRPLRRRTTAFAKHEIRSNDTALIDEQSDHDLDAAHTCSPASRWQKSMKWIQR